MRLSIIAILSANNIIGKGGGLPWHMPADLKRFKLLTMNHHLIMGRKTWDSVGHLPGRTPVVITTRSDFHAEGVNVVHSVEEAIAFVREAGDPEPFIGGGGVVYEHAIHLADRMYLTRVHADVEGDTWFPDFDDVSEWQLTDAEHFDADERHAHPYSFLTYDRAAPAGHAIPEEG